MSALTTRVVNFESLPDRDVANTRLELYASNDYFQALNRALGNNLRQKIPLGSSREFKTLALKVDLVFGKHRTEDAREENGILLGVKRLGLGGYESIVKIFVSTDNHIYLKEFEGSRKVFNPLRSLKLEDINAESRARENENARKEFSDAVEKLVKDNNLGMQIAKDIYIDKSSHKLLAKTLTLEKVDDEPISASEYVPVEYVVNALKAAPGNIKLPNSIPCDPNIDIDIYLTWVRSAHQAGVLKQATVAYQKDSMEMEPQALIDASLNITQKDVDAYLRFIKTPGNFFKPGRETRPAEVLTEYGSVKKKCLPGKFVWYAVKDIPGCPECLDTPFTSPAEDPHQALNSYLELLQFAVKHGKLEGIARDFCQQKKGIPKLVGKLSTFEMLNWLKVNQPELLSSLPPEPVLQSQPTIVHLILDSICGKLSKKPPEDGLTLLTTTFPRGSLTTLYPMGGVPP